MVMKQPVDAKKSLQLPLAFQLSVQFKWDYRLNVTSLLWTKAHKSSLDTGHK